jgi:hypothetical protein
LENIPLKAFRGIRVVESREGKGGLRISFDYRENNCAEISGHFHWKYDVVEMVRLLLRILPSVSGLSGFSCCSYI